jgi:hypothetical protein
MRVAQRTAMAQAARRLSGAQLAWLHLKLRMWPLLYSAIMGQGLDKSVKPLRSNTLAQRGLRLNSANA